MHVVGPVSLRLVFQAFVVIVGFLMLAGAVNTAIVGSNGVLNRVSEDGVLTDWFRKPHRRFGTTYRLINLIVDPADRHDPDQPRQRHPARRGLRVRRGVELRLQRARGARAALQAAGHRARLEGAVQRPSRRPRAADRRRLIALVLFHLRGRSTCSRRRSATISGLAVHRRVSSRCSWCRSGSPRGAGPRAQRSSISSS